MADTNNCPVTACGHRKRPSDLVCRIHWYVLDDKHKRAWRTALAALKVSRSAHNVQALLVVKKHALDSLNPTRNPHVPDHQA